MKLIKYPDEIEKLMKVYEPYVNHIHDGKIENVPEEVSEAFEKNSNRGKRTSRFYENTNSGWRDCRA